jgi:PAS domain S-box-containing protein
MQAPWGDWRLVNEPLHATLETLGGLAFVVMATFLLLRKQGEYGGKLFLLAMGFLSMGLLDVFHATTVPGQGFVLLHCMASLAAGFWFVLVWLPWLASNKYAVWKGWAPWVVVGASVLFGIWALVAEETLPAMVQGGKFTPAAMALNLLAGVFFVSAAARFLLDFHISGKLEIYLFAWIATLFGLANLTFRYSALWDSTWWLWHLLRLTACLLALGFVVREYQRMVSNLEATLAQGKRAEEALRQSKEFVEVVFNSINDCLCVVDTNDFRIVGANRVFLDKYMGEEDLIGRPCYEVTHQRSKPCEPPNDLCPLQQTLRTGSHSSAEHIHYDKLGVEGYFEVLTSPIRNEKGEIDRVVHIARDITERKRAEQALRESEERLRAIMEQSPEAIFLVDVETGRILEANSAFQDLLGYSSEEIVGLPVFDLVSADREIMDRRFQDTIQAGRVTSDERQYRTKDGSLIDVWVSRKAVSYAGKKVMCVILHDLTERKQAEAEREKLIQELQEALANGKTLRGLIPICANCKKIRDDKGYWQQVEVYVHEHSEAKFTHGLCPECAKLLFPELEKKREGGNPI